MKERHTRQLAAIYQAVSTAGDHPTAEDIHTRVRRKLPRVSLGTVYRNLQKLAAQRRLRIVHLADRAARYDAMIEDHNHFACEYCGAVTDLISQQTPPPDSSALTHDGYVVRRHALTFYGMCPRCRGANSSAARRRVARS